MLDERRNGAKTAPGYDADFTAWASHQAMLLREQKWDALDLLHLIEEIEGLTRSDRRGLRSSLRILLMHLLKWRYQPERRVEGHSWEDTIVEQRKQVQDYVTESPSLNREVAPLLRDNYAHAKRRASIQTELPLETFPEECPWTAEQVLDEDFWPEAD